MKLWQKTRVTYLDWPDSLLSTHLLERCSWNIQCSSGYRRARAGTRHTIWQKVLLKSPMIIRVQTSESQDSYLQMAMALFRAWTAMCVSFSTNLMIGLPESISPSFFYHMHVQSTVDINKANHTLRFHLNQRLLDCITTNNCK